MFSKIKFLIFFVFLHTFFLYAGLEIVRIWPDKIVYKPGEKAKIDVEIMNSDNQPKNVNISLIVNYGIDGKDKLPTQTVYIQGKEKKKVEFIYQIPEDRKWGHQAVASILDSEGNILKTESEYFSVGKNPWELGHYMTCFNIRGWKKSGKADKTVISYRQAYITAVEMFAWAPSDFDDMTPETEFWRSGQTGTTWSKEDLKYLIEKLHQNGMIAINYYNNASWGPAGAEFLRKHPDWVTYDEKGRPLVGCFYVEKLASLYKNPDQQISMSFIAKTGAFLPTKMIVGDHFINEVIKSVEMFGWDGIRSDGNPVVTSGYDYTGKFYELKDLDTPNAEFLNKVRTKLTEKFPDFLFGWNYMTTDVAGGLKAGPKSLKVMVPDAYVLWESFRKSRSPSSPFHNWKKMVKGLHKEIESVKKLGGFPHQGWMPTNKYLEAVVSSCGGHLDGYGWRWGKRRRRKELLNYRRFEFRWAEFIWDNSLRYVENPQEILKVKAPERVWWKEFVHKKELEGKERIIVHFVNMPERDDDAWTDTPPQPAENIKIKFKEKPEKFIVLSPDVEGDIVSVSYSSDGTITIPSLKIWTMVIAEYRR